MEYFGFFDVLSTVTVAENIAQGKIFHTYNKVRKQKENFSKCSLILDTVDSMRAFTDY